MDDNRMEEEVFNFSDGGVVPEKVEESEPDDENEIEEEEDSPQEKKKKSLGKRILKGFIIFLCVFLSLVLILMGSVTIFIFSKLGKITYDTEEQVVIDPNQEFIIPEGEEDIDFGTIGDAAGNDMREIIKNWATNGGTKMWEKNVLNILLIGSDASINSSWRAHSMDKGNTDAMILVSIDRKKKTIKLVSFMRDSYTYMAQFDRYAKLNAACANGGPAYLVDTIENNYKIEIDGYIMVDLDSFVQIIDTLGGIRLDVDAGLANHLSNNKDGVFPSGKNILLNGQQALKFSRVRKYYATGERARVSNQRKVINAIIEKCKGATLTEINSVIDVILANTRTNISKNTIFGYIPTALSEGWANFTITELTMPDQYTAYDYNSSQTAWVWIVDYPLAAQTTQLFLYDKTNIELPEERETAISVMGGYVPKKK